MLGLVIAPATTRATTINSTALNLIYKLFWDQILVLFILNYLVETSFRKTWVQEVYDGVPPTQFLQNVKSVCLARTRRDCVVSKSFRSSGKTAEEEVRLGNYLFLAEENTLRGIQLWTVTRSSSTRQSK